jgi:hypothetical protein
MATEGVAAAQVSNPGPRASRFVQTTKRKIGSMESLSLALRRAPRITMDLDAPERGRINFTVTPLTVGTCIQSTPAPYDIFFGFMEHCRDVCSSGG